MTEWSNLITGYDFLALYQTTASGGNILSQMYQSRIPYKFFVSFGSTFSDTFIFSMQVLAFSFAVLFFLLFFYYVFIPVFRKSLKW